MNFPISNDLYIFSVLFGVLAFVFYLSKLKIIQPLFTIFSPLLLAYLIPSLLNTFKIINSETSNLYPFSKTYLLPASLFLFTIGIDFKFLISLGKKAVLVFFIGTFSIIIGAPISFYLVSLVDESLLIPTGNNQTIKGIATIVGSWIGGGSNQTAVLEITNFNEKLYGNFILVDIFCANIYLAFLLFLISKRNLIDKYLKADYSSMEKTLKTLKEQKSQINISSSDLLILFGSTFFIVGISHFFADKLNIIISNLSHSNSPDSILNVLNNPFFLMITFVTLFAICLSFTKMNKLEQKGASTYGSFLLYFMITTIGMQVDFNKISGIISLISIGFILILFHFLVMFAFAKIFKIPFFYVAVGSQANIGGIASAPLIASIFNPKLSSVGVVLAILGYAIGTHGALISLFLMEYI